MIMKFLVTVQDKTSQQPAEPMLLDTERVSVSQWIHENLDEDKVIIVRSIVEVEQVLEP